jgi:hypothetical protein
MIDVTSPDTLSLTAACALLPRGRNGAKPHISTLLRWILDGTPAPDGRRVRLAAARLGSKWVTTRTALKQFVEALTPRIGAGTESAPTSRTPAQRARAATRAGEELDRIGI